MKSTAIRILALLFVVSLAQAEPHYTAIFGQNCFLCHSNPTGRFSRSSYGSGFFAPQYLSAIKVPDSVLARYKPQITPFLSVGADLRTIWISENTQSKDAHAGLQGPVSTNTGSMAQMEGFIYLNLQASERISITGMQATDEAGGHFELYGQANVLPWHGFLKAGQFQENFGWAFADHTSFVRTGLFGGYDGTAAGIPHPVTYGTGAEIGFRPAFLEATASYTNDASIVPNPRDSQKRWFARIQAQRGLNSLGLQFTAGASWMLAPYKPVDPEYSFYSKLDRSETWGGFGGIGWQGLSDVAGCTSGFGFLSTALLFEYDRRALTPRDLSTGQYLPPTTAAYSTAQASVMVQQGIWLTAAYDWMDNGYAVDHGKAEVERTTIGAQFFPLPWLEISPRYRLISPAGQALRNQRMGEVQAHFFF